MMNYFSMNNTLLGECYFRVSKHLGTDMITVIRQKFKPEIKMLINKYFQIILAEKKQSEEIEKEQKKYKNNLN